MDAGRGGIGLMKWTIRSVYFYLVSFVMLLTVIFGSVSLINNMIDLFEPDYSLIQLKDPATELQIRQELRRANPDGSEEDISRWAAERVQQEYDRNAAIQAYGRWSRLIRSAVLVIVALPVYLYHWKRAQQLAAE
jgi:hypothetical protein